MTTTSTTAPVPWLANSSASTTAAGASSGQSILGKDDFFKLLIAQLEYQDPLEPMDNTEFISQMANFSSLEQMNNLNNSFGQLSADFNYYMVNNFALQQTTGMANMIGQEVSYQNPDSVDEEGNLVEDILSGTISSVLMLDGIPFFMINDQIVALNGVLEIKQPDPTVED
ncbi:MAG: flagellar hook capping FlgD N-terminal domain-containing protein [Syntrophomonas sp.]|nr:flagellar hook capping FlgD N-terminal domain-containing protein [Syntrophomonas sp.]